MASNGGYASRATDGGDAPFGASTQSPVGERSVTGTVNSSEGFSGAASFMLVILRAECDTVRRPITAKRGDLDPINRLRNARLTFKRFAATEPLDIGRWR